MMTPSRPNTPNTPKAPSLRALPDEHAHLRRALDNARADARMWEAVATRHREEASKWRRRFVVVAGLNAVAWFTFALLGGR